MMSLKQFHPDVNTEFLKGKFVVKKSKRTFSVIAIDQAHEQNNASVKGDGGAVGFTENPAALRRWMVCVWSRDGSFALGVRESNREERKH